MNTSITLYRLDVKRPNETPCPAGQRMMDPSSAAAARPNKLGDQPVPTPRADGF